MFSVGPAGGHSRTRPIYIEMIGKIETETGSDHAGLCNRAGANHSPFPIGKYFDKRWSRVLLRAVANVGLHLT